MKFVVDAFRGWIAELKGLFIEEARRLLVEVRKDTCTTTLLLQPTAPSPSDFDYVKEFQIRDLITRDFFVISIYNVLLEQHFLKLLGSIDSFCF